MAENHIITAGYGGCGYTKTRPAYQYDYGQVLQLDGFPEGMLPETFEMHFSIGMGQAITRIGTAGAVAIPNVCLERFGTVTCWLFLHDAETDGETRYVIEIPVRSRGKVTDAEPTPAEQSAITEAIAALNSGVTAAAGSAEDAAEAAEDAEEARDAAEAAAESIMHAAATAETLPAGSSATASVSNVDGVITFGLGIPKGDKGDQGDRGEPGYAVVEVSETQPVEEINKLWIVDGGGATEISVPTYAEFTDLQESIDDIVMIQGTQPESENNKIWINSEATGGVQVPSYEEFTELQDAVGAKYTKPAAGIPAADLASGVIPDISGKQDKPAAAGTAGQVLGLDSGLNPVWMTQSGGATIDDTAGIGDTTKVWSADKNERERQTLNSALNDKYTKPSTGIPASDLADGVVTGTVTVTGTTPSITGTANHRYLCGECATLTISPPASGDIEVIFDSGSTATVLTVIPPTGITAVRWANDFDPDNLDANTTYDIIITDGKLGVAASWT